MYIKSALLGVLSISLTLPAYAQNNKDEDIIIVEGSRLEQTETEIGSSVTIITSEDIEMLGFDFAQDAIASAPGVTVNSNGAFGGAATVRIRGASSAQTLVLVDGIAVNDPSSPSGGFDFARLDTENIERIEILKGPQSTLWGTDAIGGVVSIKTKRPDTGLGGSAFAEYGSYNTLRAGASLENASDVADFRLAIVNTSSDGISKADKANGNSEEDGYDALTMSAKGVINFSKTARLSANLIWTDAETEFDSYSFGAQGSTADGDEASETEELSANISLTGSLFDNRLENMFMVGYTDIVRENFTNGAPSFDAEGSRTVIRYQGTFDINEKNTVAFGAEHEKTNSGDEDTSISGLFALYELKPMESLTLTGGIRVDDHKEFGSETTGRVAVAYNPLDNVTMRGSWGQGFKAPTIFQTTFFCCGATQPNAELQPEDSEAFDVGIDWRSTNGRAEAGVTYFNQDMENQISFSFGIGGYENIAEVKSQGIEAYGAYQLLDWLTLSANYEHIDAEDGDGNKLVHMPKHSGQVTLNIAPQGPLSGAILVRYNGEETNIDGTALDSWTRVDVSTSYDLTEKFEIFGRVENLLDEEYQQILGYGTPGLSGNLGIRMRY